MNLRTLALGLALTLTPLVAQAQLMHYQNSDGINQTPVSASAPLPTTTGGDVAAGSTDTGAPVKMGCLASTSPASVTSGQRQNVYCSTTGDAHVSLGNQSTFLSISNGVIFSSQGTNGTQWPLGVGDFLYNGAGQDRTVSANGSAANGTAGTGVAAVEEDGRTSSHITTLATTVVKSGKGALHAICINTKGATADTATVYDNTAGSGTVLAVIDTTSAVGCLMYDIGFNTGLTIVTAAGTAPDMTVSYR